jgi:hypothetical protein
LASHSPECFEEPLGIHPSFETNDKIIGVARDYDIIAWHNSCVKTSADQSKT